jgi:geranylgeranyl pyrophosphate synthase
VARGAEPADVLPTLGRVAASGAVADARAEAERHAAAAIAALDGLDGRVDAAALRAVVRGAVERRA